MFPISGTSICIAVQCIFSILPEWNKVTIGLLHCAYVDYSMTKDKNGIILLQETIRSIWLVWLCDRKSYNDWLRLSDRNWYSECDWLNNETGRVTVIGLDWVTGSNTLHVIGVIKWQEELQWLPVIEHIEITMARLWTSLLAYCVISITQKAFIIWIR